MFLVSCRIIPNSSSSIQRNNEHPLSIYLNRPLIKMGFFDSFSDLVAAATPWSQVEAEAPAADKDDGAKTEDSVSAYIL